MGQYYTPLLVRDNKEILTFDSHNFGCGLKLMEHSYFTNNFVNVVKGNLFKCKAIVVWMGDYADAVYTQFAHMVSEDKFKYYFKLAHSDNADTKKGEMVKVEIDLNFANYSLLNHDTREYINYESYIHYSNCDGWIVDPLPLLTACGNGQGGGDFDIGEYSIGAKHIGKWAFCELEIIYTEDVPVDYNEVEYIFVEDSRELTGRG